MAKVKVRNFVTLKNIKDQVDPSKSLLENMGEVVVQRIVDLAKRGRRMKQNGATSPLPKLSASYQAVRQGAITFRKISGNNVPFPGPDEEFFRKAGPEFDPAITRSDLYHTGELLGSLTYRLDLKRNSIEVFFEGDHGDDNFSNDQLFTWLIERTERYNVLEVQDSINKKLVARVAREIRRKTRRQNSQRRNRR